MQPTAAVGKKSPGRVWDTTIPPAIAHLPRGSVACQTGPVPSPDSENQPADHIDAEFAKIVASFDSVPEWPSHPAEDEHRGPIWPASGPVLNQPSLLDGLDTFGAHLPDDPPEKFVPPTPPPLPTVPFTAILSVLAVILGFVLFFDRDLLPVRTGVSMLLGLLCVLGGAAALIMRLRPGGDDDEPSSDDGAVV
jgi:hypothetical protein